MTQPLTVNVEKQELLARAAELEEAIPGLPSEIQALQAPCAHPPIVAAGQQLMLSANNIRLYLSVGDRERGRLAESLRNAAKAYDDADEGAAQAIHNGTPVSIAPLKVADPVVDQAKLTDTPLAAAPSPVEFQTVKQRSWDLEQPDQGAAFLAFADGWEAYRVTLLRASARFRPFTEWSGTASSAVEANFDQQRSWLNAMAELCNQLVTQARTVVDAHLWVRHEHVKFTGAFGEFFITYQDCVRNEEEWAMYSDNPDTPGFRQSFIDNWHQIQETSDEVISQYRQKANLPLAPINPPKPPEAYPIEPASDSDDIPDDGGAILPGSSSGDATAGLPSVPSMPSLPSAGTAQTPSVPNLPLAGGKDTKVPGLPKGGSPSLKAASVGLGGLGVPSTPLKDPYYATASPGPAAKGATGPGFGMPGASAGAAMGGGGMGAAPLGAQGDRGAGKAKRLQQDESAIYTENRAWTEGIIGRLAAAKNAADQKGPKS